jgi:Ca2+-binding RTX toxin-like protein
MLAAVLIAVVLLAVPAAAHATTVSVEPYVIPPHTDPSSACARQMNCPPDMVVVTAGPNENNGVLITAEGGSVPVEGSLAARYRFVVRDGAAQVQAGAGCAQVDFWTASCSAGIIGPVRLGDGDDWFAATWGVTDVHGGPGQDVLQDVSGRMSGGPGDDVIVAREGTGGGGDDVVMANYGAGGPGDDIVRCFHRGQPCTLDGGPGDDQLTGGLGVDRIFGRGGADRLVGGPGDDRMRGGRGTDSLVSREDFLGGERAGRDRVDCGAGRRDRAVADRWDKVLRSCEREAPGAG